MFRNEIAKNLDHDPDFKWRSENVTRIENISDIAFALALSMLVAGSGIPETYSDLQGFLFSILPVAVGFSFLLGIWKNHFTFFRRYGLNDNRILRLNAMLIFIVLYMAYPLRFALDSLFAFILMQMGYPEMMTSLGIAKFEMSGVIIAYFAIAYAAAHFLFALMHRHVYQQREKLNLDSQEILTTQRQIFTFHMLWVLGVFVALIAYFTWLNGFAGILLFFTFVPAWAAKKRYPSQTPTTSSD